MENKDQSAFPIIATDQSIYNQYPAEPQPGLTKREYFAAMAMQGLLANPELFKHMSDLETEDSITIMNVFAVDHADKLLKQLSETSISTKHSI